MSEDQLGFIRKLAATKYRYPDDKLAIAEFLERWSLSPGATCAERRMALRLFREDALLNSAGLGDEPAVSALPSVQKALQQSGPNEESEDRLSDDSVDDSEPPHPESGDDEDEEAVDAIEVTEFYADSFEDA